MSTKDLIRRGEALPTVFHDFFKPWDKWFDTNGGSLAQMLTIPAVNILEKKDRYEISFAAPGMKKKDFDIDVEGKMLTKSAEKKQEKKKKKQKHTRGGFNYTSFSPSFTFPG